VAIARVAAADAPNLQNTTEISKLSNSFLPVTTMLKSIDKSQP